MLHVYNVSAREEKQLEKCDLEKLISFQKASGIQNFKPLFDGSSSLVWKPQLNPPVLSNEAATLNENKSAKNNIKPKVKKTKECIQSVSPVLQNYLKNDTQNNDREHPLTKIKWHSSPTNIERGLKSENRLYENDQKMIECLRERARSSFNPNCRGKWIILVSSMINDFTLEDLWMKLSDDLHQNYYKNCTITFQTCPDCILIYTDFLSSAMVPKAFSCIKRMVRQMTYTVHPCGPILSYSWTSGVEIL